MQTNPRAWTDPLFLAGLQPVPGGSATVTDGVATFSAPNRAPLKSCVVNITPVQSGTGDPSPTNVRPISGWTTVHIYHSGADTSDPTAVTFTFPSDPGTIYGGTLAIAEDGSVTLTKTWERVDLGTLSWVTQQAGGPNRFRTSNQLSWRAVGYNIQAICDSYAFWGNKTLDIIRSDLPNGYFACQPTNGFVWFCDTNYSDPDDFKTAMSGVYLYAEMRTPVTYTLTPITPLTALRGVNNIWADSGDVAVNFRGGLHVSDLSMLSLTRDRCVDGKEDASCM